MIHVCQLYKTAKLERKSEAYASKKLTWNVLLVKQSILPAKMLNIDSLIWI